MSKGLPPPPPSFFGAAFVEAAASVSEVDATVPCLDVAVMSIGVVVVATDTTWVEVGGVDIMDDTAVVDSAVLLVSGVLLTCNVLLNSGVLLTSGVEVLASAVLERVVGMVTCTCEVAALDVLPPPPVTPGLPVGIVTETSAELAATGVVVFAIVVVVALSTAGHKAGIMPPSMTIPSNAFEFTITFAQPLCTFFATWFNPN